MSQQPNVVLFEGASQIATCTGPPREEEGGDPAGVVTGQTVVVRGGRVEEVTSRTVRQRYPDAEVVNCSGSVVTPGLVDSHTHAVFGKWRADEYALRSRGVPYMEIARRGGGILSSVRDLRDRDEEGLFRLAMERIPLLMEGGTTTLEIKSGYALSTEHELKTLRVIERLRGALPIRIVPTFLGAHEFPAEYRDRREAYVDLLVEEMIPAVAEQGIARFCDVFMEPGVYDRPQTARVLLAARENGMELKLHADELEGSGGAELGAELGAVSVDHLGAISPAGVGALASSSTVATLLPGTLFFLGRQRYAPARDLLDAGATVALATDFNPGSCPAPSLQFTMTAACSQMGLSPREALRAVTAGGASALGLTDGTGTLRPGAPADLVVWRAESVEEIPYRLATPLTEQVWVGGERLGPPSGLGSRS